jgi:glycosyltransferase involved in cell wall biosynthesis
MSAPPRPLLFLIRSLHRGGAERQLVLLALGAERQLVLLALELQRRGVPVAVATFYGGGAFGAELQAGGVPLHDLRKGGRWSYFGFLRRLWRLCRELRPAVLHGYLPAANLVAIAMKPLLRRTRTAVVCGVRAAGLDPASLDWATGLSEQLHVRLVGLADAVISNSQAGLEHVRQGCADRGQYHVVDNGIDVQHYRFTAVGRQRLREAWRVRPDEPLVGLVGRHDAVKDQGLFLAAAACLRRRRGGVRFVLVGDEVDPLSTQLRAQAARLGLDDALIWAGPRDDIPAVYSALDVLCLSSAAEGFPNVVAEAMSCGLPCVCTDVGDVRRLLGDCGWVADARTPEALAAGLEQALDALPHWDAARPRRRIEQHFSAAMLAERTLAVLGPLLRNPGP